jgi:ABC-type nitrate/sulfonate/bicarbonate transport system substrate-binding protein
MGRSMVADKASGRDLCCRAFQEPELTLPFVNVFIQDRILEFNEQKGFLNPGVIDIATHEEAEDVMKRHSAGSWLARGLAAAILSTSLLWLAPAPATALEKLRVAMATKASSLYAPYLVAIEKGYYAEEGLELDITIAGGGVATPAQIAGDIDINTSGPVALTPILRGSPLKIVYTLATHSTDELWSTSKDVKTIQDLKGKQIGIISRGDTNEIAVKMALLKAGLPIDYVNFTALGQANTSLLVLKSASLPAVVAAGVFVEIARAAGDLNKGNLVYSFFKDLPMPYSGVAVTDRFLNSRRDRLAKFLRATLKGASYMKANPRQTIAIMSKYDTQSTTDQLAIDYDKVRSVLTPDGTVAEDVRAVDLKVRASIIGLGADKIPPMERIYDYSIVRETNAELERSGWQPRP